MRSKTQTLSILRSEIKQDNEKQRSKNVAMSAIVCLTAGIMLVMNIMRHSTLMTMTSVILVAGFACTGILAGVFNKTRISTIIMAALLTGVFTVFPISGGNEGFAVLWLLLIPLFSISLFGMRIGIGMNIYFTVLILLLFYSPMNIHISGLYTENFMHRFPILFITDLATSQTLALSNEYYYKVNRLQVFTDDMTGVYNRRYFIELLGDPACLKNDLCISVIDVNGLKETNDSRGHAAGDEMICAVPQFVKHAFGKDAVIARMGGDEFAVLTYDDPESISEKIGKMKKTAEKHKGELINGVYLSVGTACRSEFKDLDPEALYRAADKLMYEDKTAYYRIKGNDRRRR